MTYRGNRKVNLMVHPNEETFFKLKLATPITQITAIFWSRYISQQQEKLNRLEQQQSANINSKKTQNSHHNTYSEYIIQKLPNTTVSS